MPGGGARFCPELKRVVDEVSERKKLVEDLL